MTPTTTAPQPGGPLSRLAVRGALWAGLSQYFLFGLGIVKTMILARLVPPEIFGLVALATVWVSYLTIFRFDMRTVIVSHQEIKPSTLSVQFVLDNALLAIGFGLALGVQLALPGLGTPELWLAVYVLLASRLTDTLSSTPQYLLEKNLQQDVLARLTALGAVAGMGAAVLLAWRGLFLEALLADAAAPLAVMAVGAWLAAGWRPRWAWDSGVAREILGFGYTLWTTSLLGKITFEFDDWLVGSISRPRAFDYLSSGLRAEGFYSRAYNTAKMPMDIFAGMIGRIGLSLYAESAARGREVLVSTYRRTTWLLARMIFYSSTLGFVAAEEITVLLLGDTWLPMVPLFRLMYLFVVGRPFFQNSSQLLLATRHEKEMRFTVGVQAVIMLVAGPPAVWFYGAAGASVVVSVMMIAGLVASERYVIGLLGVPVWRTYLWPGLVSLAVALGFWALTPWLAGYHPLVSLGIKGAACTAIYVAAAVFVERGDAQAVYTSIRENLRP